MVRLCAVHYHDTHRLRRKKQLCLHFVPTVSCSGPEHIQLLISFVCFVLFFGFILKTNDRKQKILRGECYSSCIANSENSFLRLIRYTDISRLLYQQYVCRPYKPVHIVAFSRPSESWQLNGQSISLEIRRLRLRFRFGVNVVLCLNDVKSVSLSYRVMLDVRHMYC